MKPKSGSASTTGGQRPPTSLSRRFLSSAVSLTLLYGLATLLGWRQHTSFLSGTVGDPNVSWERAALEGTIYLVLHFGFVAGVPILFLAALLSYSGERLRRTRHGQ